MRQPGANQRLDKAHVKRMGTFGDTGAQEKKGLPKVIAGYTSSAMIGKRKSSAAARTRSRC
jgi:hypothetical protein